MMSVFWTINDVMLGYLGVPEVSMNKGGILLPGRSSIPACARVYFAGLFCSPVNGLLGVRTLSLWNFQKFYVCIYRAALVVTLLAEVPAKVVCCCWVECGSLIDGGLGGALNA